MKKQAIRVFKTMLRIARSSGEMLCMRRWRLGMVLMGAALFAALRVSATIYVWDGGGTSNAWSIGENWNPDGSVPLSSSDTTVSLNGNVRTTMVQDLATPFVLNRLEFLNDGATKPSFNLTGNAFRVMTNQTSQPYFYLTRTATCTMNNPIEIPADTQLNLYFTTYGLTLSGIISGEGGIDKQAQDGGLTLDNGGNTFSGGLTVRASDKDWCKVAINASGALGTGPVNLYGGTLSTTFNNPGGLIFNNSTTHTNAINLFADSPILVGMTNDRGTRVTLNGPVSLGTNTLHLRGGGIGVINGPISGTGIQALKKNDVGTWVLAGANTFTGRVTVADGVLTLSNATVLVAGTPVMVSGGSLNLNGLTLTNNNITPQGGVISNGALYVADTSTLGSGDMRVPLSGPAGIVKSGPGTLMMRVANDYAGKTTVSAGTLQFALRTALYGGDTARWTDTNIVVSSGATLALNVGGSGEFTTSDLDLFQALGTASGGFLSGSFLGVDTSYAPGGFVSYNTSIGNPNGNMRGFVKMGTGTLELGGLSTFTGPMRLSNGVVSVSVLADGGVASGLGMSSAHRDNLVFAGGALRYTGPSVRIDRGFKYATATNSYIFDIAQTNTTLTFWTITNAVFDGNNTTIVKKGPGALTFAKGAGSIYNFPVKAIHIFEGGFFTDGTNSVQHNVHSLASQGPAILLGDGAVLGFNNPMENYINGDEMMVQYVGTQRGARVTAGSWLLCGPTTNTAGTLLYNTHIFDVNDGADAIDLDIQGTLSIYTGIANSYLRKTGAGTLRFKSTSNAYRGTTIIRDGRLLVTASVPKGGASVLGNCTNDVIIGDQNTALTNAPTFAFEGAANSTFTFARGILCASSSGVTSTIGSISNVNSIFSGTITVSNTVQLLSVTTGTNALFVTGGITGPGGVRLSSTGLVVFVAANSYTGSTVLAAGTLQLSAAERIADTSAIHLSGGTLTLNGFSETAGSLDVDGASVIDFGNGASTLTLADSSHDVWNGSLLLRNMTAGVDHLFIGTSATLSDAQLARITSPLAQKAKQTASGEVILMPLGTVLTVR